MLDARRKAEPDACPLKGDGLLDTLGMPGKALRWPG